MRRTCIFLVSCARAEQRSSREAVPNLCPSRLCVPPLPVMSFVTYVLLISVILGLSNKFRPEILGLTASRALIIIGVELLLIKLACYLLNVQGNHYGILDLTSYAGYKFVPACVTLAASALKLGGLVWWMSFVYSFAALAFFLVSQRERRGRLLYLRPKTNPLFYILNTS